MEGGFFAEETQILSKDGEEDTVMLPVSPAESCMHCSGIPVSQEMRSCFEILVCGKCRRYKVRLITKTKCREHYLLTEEEIQQFKYLTRSNPHRGSWNDMQLYFEDEIARFSIQKHGSSDALERTKEERAEQLKRRKMGKIKKQIRGLKQKVFLKPRADPHRHVFERVRNKGVCGCGMEVDLEEL